MKIKETFVVPFGDVIVKSGKGKRIIGQGCYVVAGSTVLECSDERTAKVIGFPKKGKTVDVHESASGKGTGRGGA